MNAAPMKAKWDTPSRCVSFFALAACALGLGCADTRELRSLDESERASLCERFAEPLPPDCTFELHCINQSGECNELVACMDGVKTSTCTVDQFDECISDRSECNLQSGFGLGCRQGC